MKRRTLFFLMVMLFAFCGVFTNGLVFFQASAASSNASVWDGKDFLNEDGSLQNNIDINDFDIYSDGSDLYIYSAKGLAYFASQINATSGYDSRYLRYRVHLESDIDLAGHSWLPIGWQERAFAGTFDGQGHYIYNLKIDEASVKNDKAYAGFFGTLGTNANVSGLNFKNAKIDISQSESTAENAYVGIVAGKVENGVYYALQNSSAEGQISVKGFKNPCVGGLVGEYGAASTNDVYASVQLEVVGSQNQTTADENCVGGLFGKTNELNLVRAFSGLQKNQDFKISAKDFVAINMGGLVGLAEGQLQINNSYSVMGVDYSTNFSSSAPSLGGLVGSAQRMTTNHAYAANSISWSVAASGNVNVGKFVGSLQAPFSSNFNNSFSLNPNAAISLAPTGVGLNKTYDKASFFNLSNLAKTEGFYCEPLNWTEVWNFDTVWQISSSENFGLPILRAASSLGNADGDENIYLIGEGTLKNPYQIYTAGDLGAFAKIVNADATKENFNAVLLRDVDLSGKSWTPIAYGKTFNGVFDGNGHRISGLTCSLQNQYAYHGLFGQTGDAVIKNLTLDDVRFVNEGVEKNIKGNLIGNVAGNTYVINCRDTAARTGLSIGNINKAANLFVLSGKDNLTPANVIRENEITYATTPISSSERLGTVKLGYDMTISGEGGVFYNAAGDSYVGKYHVLMDEAGKIIPVVGKGTTNWIDDSFGSTLLPELSTSWGQADIVTRRGFKLVGYQFLIDDTDVSFDEENEISNKANAFVYGLKAVWNDGKPQTVKVVYNQYEKDNFGGTIDSSAAYNGATLSTGETLVLDEETGLLYVEYQLVYDSYLEETENTKIFKVPQFSYAGQTKRLREDKFELEKENGGVNLYTNKQFLSNQTVDQEAEGKVNSSATNVFVNDNLGILYAKWDGLDTEKATGEITVKLTNSAGDQSDVLKAIDNLTFLKKVEDQEEPLQQQVSKDSFSQVGKELVYTFSYNTQISSSMQNYGTIRLQLKYGFSLEPSNIVLRTTSNDQNFGRLTVEDGNMNAEGGYIVSTKSSDAHHTFEFTAFNFVGDYEFVFDIKRENFFSGLEISDEVAFGISPKIKLVVNKEGDQYTSNVGMYQLINSSYKDILDILDDAVPTRAEELKESLFKISEKAKLPPIEESTAVKAAPLYVAFDLVKGRILFSSGDFVESVNYAGFGSFEGGNSTSFKYTTQSLDETGTIDRYFTFTKYTITREVEAEDGQKTSNVFNEISLIETEVDLSTCLDSLVTVTLDENLKYTQLSFKSFANFTFMFSSEQQDVNSVVSWKYDIPATENNSKVEVSAVDFERENSVTTQPKQVVEFTDFVVENNNGILQVTTDYAKAVFDVVFKKVADDGSLVDLEPLTSPTFQFVNENVPASAYDVSDGTKTINLNLTASKHYRLKGTNSDLTVAPVLYNDAGFNIKIEALSVSTSKAIADGQSQEQAQKEADDFKNAINQNNNAFFNSTTADGPKATISFNTNGSYNISLPYNFATSYNLYAGHYVIYLVCEYVPYTVEFGAKSIDYASYAAQDIVYENLNSVNDSKISTSLIMTRDEKETEFVALDNAEDKGVKVLSDVHYSDRFKISSSLGENQAYSQVGWLYVAQYTSESGTKQYVYDYVASKATINSRFDSLYSRLENFNNGKLTIYAIYVEKHIDINISNSVEVVMLNGSDDTNLSTTAGALGLEFNFRQPIEEGFTYAKSLDFNYSKSAENQTLSMTGSNADGYYIYGFRAYRGDWQKEIMLSESQVQGLSKDECKNFEVDFSFLSECLENGELGNITQTIYLLPLIRQKTVSVYFHSGTGDAYSDGLGGEVFDVNGNETTGNVYKFGDKLYFRQSLGISSSVNILRVDDGSNAAVSMTAEDLFARRTGYVKPATNHWAWNDNTILMSQFDFDASPAYYVDGANGEIHLYLKWQPNTYQINFNANGGLFENESASMTREIDYDTNLDAYTLVPTQLSKAGYTFMGWKLATAENALFDKEGKFADPTDEAYKNYIFNGRFRFIGTMNLEAIWQANIYDIVFDFNSGADEAGNLTSTQSIVYDGNFDAILDVEGNLKDVAFSRAGYRFDGFYSTEAGVNQKITASTTFNQNILSFDFNETPVLKLYARWLFNEDDFQLSLNDYMHESLTYTGATQRVNIAEYFTKENCNNKGFNIVVDEENLSNFSISLSETNAKATGVRLSLSSSSATVLENVNTYFVVKDVNYYSVTFTVSLIDESLYLKQNDGVVKTFVFNLGLYVNKASLDINYTNKYYVTNAISILKNFVTLDQLASLESATNLSNLVSVFKTQVANDPTLTGATDEEIYNYILVKYYLLTTTNGEEYQTYKEWKYADYLAYCDLDGNRNSEILSNLKFYTFYDHTLTLARRELDAYSDAFTLKSDANITGFEIDRVETVSVFGLNFACYEDYELRVYLKENENSFNFQLSNDGQDYFVIGRIFVLPEIVMVRNHAQQKTAYHSPRYTSTRQVDWQGVADKNPVELDGQNFFEIGDLLVSAGLFTSDAGKSNSDTTYSFYAQENYLFFDNVKILRDFAGQKVDVSRSFKLVLDERDTFEILSSDGVAQIKVAAKYLTKQDGTTQLSMLENDAVKLSVQQVQYELGGQTKTITSTNGLPQTSGAFVDEEATIFEIYNNNSFEVSIYVNQAVKTIIFATSTRTIGSNIALYKWSEGDVFDVDGTMENRDTLEINMDDIILQEQGLTEVNINATYTDLVKISYQLNFPNSYATSAITASTLKLGESRIEDVETPVDDNFTCTSLKVVNGRNLLELDSLFNEEGVFVGLNKFDAITLSAKWAADLVIEINQHITDYKAAVATFDGFTVSDIMSITNMRSELFDYAYSWQKYSTEGIVKLADGQTFILPTRGSAEDNGVYGLVVTATLKRIFNDALENVESNTYSRDVNFDLTFYKHILENITVPENATLVFDNKDHINDFEVQVQYRTYNAQTNSYDTEIRTLVLNKASAGNFADFVVNCNDEEVSSALKVGKYEFNIALKDSIFSFSEEEPFTFEVQIMPLTVELINESITDDKFFNQPDEMLEKQLIIYSNGTAIGTTNLTLTRQAGENVGEYALYLDGVKEEDRGNYNFTYNGVMLYENGAKTAAAANTAIGTFIIMPSSGTLKLSYDTATASAQQKAAFNEKGYTISLTQDFQLVISGADGEVARLALRLFDTSTNAFVSQEIFTILSQQNDISAYFMPPQKDTAVSVGDYTYLFLGGEKFAHYYSAVEMETGFSFSITPLVIETKNFVVSKVYDGETVVYLDVSGNKIENLKNFSEDLYIEATFTSRHAGTVDATLKIMQKEDSEIFLSNYALSQEVVSGTIEKRKAEIVFEMTQNSFVYGKINTADFEELGNLISQVSLLDEEGNNISALLMSPYYSINFKLNADAKDNGNGFLYKGSYVLTPDCNFDDFNMSVKCKFAGSDTVYDNFNFEVTTLVLHKTISQGMVTITADEAIENYYTDSITIEDTGEIIALRLAVAGQSAGSKLAAGTYDFELASGFAYYPNDSVVVSLNEANKGLLVVSASDTLFVRLDITSALHSSYKGSAFTIETDNDAKTMTISSLGAVRFSFYTRGASGENPVTSNLPNISFTFNGRDEATAVDAYSLTVRVNGEYNTYGEVVKDKEYIFEITPIEIDVNALKEDGQFTMQFKRDVSTKAITTFDEILEQDKRKVSVLANFKTADVGSKNVSLYLQGERAANYVLSTNSVAGEITKAGATLTLSENTFVYGQITKGNEFTFTAKSVYDDTIYATEYTTSVEIVGGGNYSKRDFLQGGTYTLRVSATATNYSFETLQAQITISAYDISLTFKKGEFTFGYGSANATNNTFVYIYRTRLDEEIEILLTREEGSQLGTFYHIISGQIQDEQTARNYNLTSVRDPSDGAVLITGQNERVYVLFEDGSTSKDFLYDGKQYSKFEIIGSGNTYYLQLSNPNDLTAVRQIKLGFFSLVGDVYQRYDDSFVIEGLKSSLKCTPDVIRGQGVYRIYSSGGTTSDTHNQVKLGKNDGSNYCFTINITTQKLTLKDEILQSRILQKAFTNEDVAYSVDATELFDGVIGEDVVTVTVEFFKNDLSPAKYVGLGYKVKLTLDDTSRTNYYIDGVGEDGFVSGLTGQITKANLSFVTRNHNFVYGEEIVLDYQLETELENFNMKEYLASGRKFDIDVMYAFDQNADLSSSGHLKVKSGGYAIMAWLDADDFAFSKYILREEGKDDDVQNELNAKVNILPKTLSLRQRSETLEEVFSKTYDETDEIELKHSGSLRFGIDGAFVQDVFEVASGKFASSTVGKQSVQFTLTGIDSENYVLPDFEDGQINPVVIEVEFNIPQGTSLNVENPLSAIAFPLQELGSLTANSFDTSEQFPTNFVGDNSVKFEYWTLNFDNLTETQKNWLAERVQKYHLTPIVNGDSYRIRIDNDADSVQFLSELLNDSDNVLGLYYKNNKKLVLAPYTTDANFNISIKVADENGATVSDPALKLGTFTMDGKQGQTQISTNLAYGSSFTVQAVSNTHTFFEGFYNGVVKITGSEDGFVVDAVNNTLTVMVAADLDLVLRFTVQRVKINLDLADYSNARVISSTFEKVPNQNMYTWTTDYNTAFSLNFNALPTISNIGYTFKGVTYGSENTMVKVADFANVKLSTPIESVTTRDCEFTLKVVFEQNPVNLVLDYGFDGRTQNAVVLFDAAYSTALDEHGDLIWKENLVDETGQSLRTGYAFLGWFIGDVRVYGSDLVSTTTDHTLIAKWEIERNALTISSKHADIIESSHIFENTDGTYTLQDVEYGTQITFTLAAKRGWQLQDNWGDDFIVTTLANGNLRVILSMPEHPVEVEVPVVALKQNLTISGQHLGNVLVENLTDESEVTANELGQYVVETGKKLQITVSAQTGYALTGDVDFSENSLTVTPDLNEDGTLVILLENGIDVNLDILIGTMERNNEISLTFEDASKVEAIRGFDSTSNRWVTYTPENLPTFHALTNRTFIFYVKFKEGYVLKAATSEVFDEVLAGEKGSDEYYEISAIITSDGTILVSAKPQTYTISVQVLSLDSAEPILGNQAFVCVNGQNLQQAEVDFASEVTLVVTSTASSFSFIGWSRDGITVINSLKEYPITVEKDENFFAMFSSQNFSVELGTLNVYDIFTEYGDAEKVQTVYSQLEASYLDENGLEIVGPVQMFNRVDKQIQFVVPEGFIFAGFGFFNEENEFVYLNRSSSLLETVQVMLESAVFDQYYIEKLFMVVNAYSMSIQVESEIDFVGQREKDSSAVKVTLSDAAGNEVNAYDYVEGTRIHYQTKEGKNKFEAIAYSNDKVYLKIALEREGFKFDGHVEIDGIKVEDPALTYMDDFVLVELPALLGGVNASYEVKVVVKPLVNTINLSFENNGEAVDGGVFEIASESSNRVWTSGVALTSMQVSAYTDSRFTVSAYIRPGFVVDENNLQIAAAENMIENVACHLLSIPQTGFAYLITFDVVNFVGANEIVLNLLSNIYVVALKDGENVLAKIKNVEFGSVLDLSQSNAENIEILDSRLQYSSGKLNVQINKAKHHFQGYFTYPNGAGVQYITSSSESVKPWQESGYVLNTLTHTYQLTDNARWDENGQIEISLYLYLSYLKTRINFEVQPNVSAAFTAEDIVEGVDYSNSWFYITQPLYMEVAFDTNVYFNAPQIEGYKFFKFVISQMNADGTWISDAVSFSERVPWSTNEYDNFVECRVQIVYFAQVDVRILGGEATYTISQADSDAQAQALQALGYVDTSKPFTIEAKVEEGYSFVSWRNLTSGENPRFNTVYTGSTTQKVTLVLNLLGKDVSLDFSDYNSTYGQIVQLDVRSMDGGRQVLTLGSYSGGQFVRLANTANVKVGDEVTFVVNVNYGFAVQWNREDITLDSYVGRVGVGGGVSKDRYHFVMTVSKELAEKKVKITPTFEDNILSIYISVDFQQGNRVANAVDDNKVEFAGSVTDKNGRSVKTLTANKGEEVEFLTTTNSKYKISSITIKNYSKVFDQMSQFMTEDGRILLTQEFLTSNEIVGTVTIDVRFERVYWIDEPLEVGSFEGRGTAKNPYQISSLQDLVLMMKLVNEGQANENGAKYRDCSYVLNANLDLSEKFWTPIGTKENAFNGRFNFNGHLILGVSNAIFYDPIEYNGLFGNVTLKAVIEGTRQQVWIIYLSVGISVFLIVLVFMLVWINFKRKKRRQQMQRK